VGDVLVPVVGEGLLAEAADLVDESASVSSRANATEAGELSLDIVGDLVGLVLNGGRKVRVIAVVVEVVIFLVRVPAKDSRDRPLALPRERIAALGRAPDRA